ncbi:calcium-transporting ATPase 10, plasma membrane-type-like [Hibiscus syriacus]|uniref:calcium-transporting ATPase 10, plasma membrane-type-like n=1 Tax=Hibiscus syriacus TaxID=106335 RepID=UPI001922EBAE|nr:calcium-transporting ATPase 10, plasma membrane-type-like [Hibiscus syriacus]
MLPAFAFASGRQKKMQAALVLNASRRFRYTLDLKKEEATRQTQRRIRSHEQCIRAAWLFHHAGVRAADLFQQKFGKVLNHMFHSMVSCAATAYKSSRFLVLLPSADFPIVPEHLALMTVVEAYVGGRKIDPPDSSSELPGTVTSLLTEDIAVNANGSVFTPEGGGDVEVSGSPTEKAILNWGMKLGMDFDVVRCSSSILHVFPFNTKKKRGGVAIRLPDSKVRNHWKGAAEIVLAACTWYIDTNGETVAVDEEKVALFEKAIETMSAGSIRCVAIAYRLYESENVLTNEEELAR